MTQPLTGMDFSSDSTNDDFSFESSTTTAQLLLTKVLLRLHWLCSYLDFFPRASPLSERSVELRSFRFLLLFFCSWYLNTPYTETILNCLHLKHLTFQLFPGIASPYSQVVTRFPLTGITYLRITCCMVRLVVLIGCDLFPNTAHIFSFVFPDFRKKGYPVVSPIFFQICFNID